MRALVTGCAGFIGSHLSESLLADGQEVVGVDCFNDNYGRPHKLRNLERARQWEGFDFVPIDLARGDLGDVVEGCDAVFHLAAEPGVASWGRRFESYVRNNVLATQHLLEAVAAHPGRRVVYASSSSVYGDAARLPTPESAAPAPISPYGVTKLGGEHLCHAYGRGFGVETVVLRYFSVYGPRQRPDMAFQAFCSALVAREPVVLHGDGRQVRDFTHVADVVAATRAAALAPGAAGATLNVGGGERTSLAQALALLEERAGRRAEVVRAPGRAGDVRETGADCSAAQAILGYAPQVSVADGLSGQWAWTVGQAGRAAAA
ncbi:MAG: NAD-dependent epimerase/dehydratase family protein, partial [Actinomycetota bacterium]|nr:NAD-dependent epimerase/dehydratase family protein [Actinomycetota bacterium]